jgi:hypothetical protein
MHSKVYTSWSGGGGTKSSFTVVNYLPKARVNQHVPTLGTYTPTYFTFLLLSPLLFSPFISHYIYLAYEMLNLEWEWSFFFFFFLPNFLMLHQKWLLVTRGFIQIWLQDK